MKPGMGRQITIPEGLESMGDAIQRLLDAVQTGVGEAKSGGQAVNYAEIERKLAERSAEVERSGHGILLAALDVDSARVVIGGEPYTRVGRSSMSYYTLAGPVVVERSLYRRNAARNSKVVDAVSLRAGTLGAGWLPATATAMGYLIQQGTAREAEESGRLLGRAPYSHSSMERIAQLIGDGYTAEAGRVDAVLIAKYQIPAKPAGISLSLDRISVPMEEPRAKPRGRPRAGAPKNPIQRVFRMAYVGTLTLHDGDGEALDTLYYGAMPSSEGRGVALSMASDAAALVERNPDLSVVLLADGAPEMWNLLKEGCSAAGIADARELLDLWHLIEKLSAASKVVHGVEGTAAAVNRYRSWLLNDPASPMKLHKEFADSGKEYVAVGESHPVHEAMTYLLNHMFRMDYVGARADGQPVGSGAVEAGCKSLFAVRLKRSGSRWKEPSAQNVVHLRALALGGRYAEAMRLTLEPGRKAVDAAG